MTVSIRQVGPCFAGEVSGVDLTKPLSREEVAAIEAGMDKYAVLVFHDQPVTDDQQIDFSRNFGSMEPGAGTNTPNPRGGPLRVETADVSNQKKGNELYARDARRRIFNPGNRLWHSDSSFRATPAKYSL